MMLGWVITSIHVCRTKDEWIIWVHFFKSWDWPFDYKCWGQAELAISELRPGGVGYEKAYPCMTLLGVTCNDFSNIPPVLQITPVQFGTKTWKSNTWMMSTDIFNNVSRLRLPQLQRGYSRRNETLQHCGHRIAQCFGTVIALYKVLCVGNHQCSQYNFGQQFS